MLHNWRSLDSQKYLIGIQPLSSRLRMRMRQVKFFRGMGVISLAVNDRHNDINDLISRLVQSKSGKGYM